MVTRFPLSTLRARVNADNYRRVTCVTPLPLEVGATAAVEGLDGEFAVLDWDHVTVRLLSPYGVEFRAGRKAVRVLGTKRADVDEAWGILLPIKIFN